MTYHHTTRRNSSRRSGSLSRNRNSVAYASAIKLGPVTHTVLIALMLTVLGLIYLTQATKATSYDYAIQGIDTEIAELSVQKNDLEVENARLSSLESIENSTVAKNMEAPSDVSYAE
jgi:cell division protein FtsL